MTVGIGEMLDPTARAISPSAIGSAGRCGWAWEYNYRYGMKPPKESVPAFLGTISHRAHEQWALNHSLDMVELTKQAWLEQFVDEPGMHRITRAFQKLNDQGLALMDEIRTRRPEIKVVTMTKDWKESEVGKAINKFEHTHAAILEKDKRDWASNSFTASYMDTIELAGNYQEKWCDSPEAMFTELKYEVEVAGMQLYGVIDELNILIDSNGEVLGYLVSDYKTYGKEPKPIKDFIQLCHYRIATEYWLPFWCDQLGVVYHDDWPIFCAIDLGRMLKRQVYYFSQEQLDLGIQLTKQYDQLRGLPMLPNFKGSCDYCEWLDECTHRVGMAPLEVE